MPEQIIIFCIGSEDYKCKEDSYYSLMCYDTVLWSSTLAVVLQTNMLPASSKLKKPKNIF
jgi:hypothetical protein